MARLTAPDIVHVRMGGARPGPGNARRVWALCVGCMVGLEVGWQLQAPLVAIATGYSVIASLVVKIGGGPLKK